MRLVSTISLLLIAAFPLTATAQGVCQLPDGVENTGGYKHPSKDVGGGFVAYWFSWISYDGKTGDRFLVRDCKSNALIVADVDVRSVRDDPLAMRVENTFSEIQSSSVIYTVSDVIAAFRDAGAESDFISDTTNLESCGCSVFYPELRGAKTPFEEHGQL